MGLSEGQAALKQQAPVKYITTRKETSSTGLLWLADSMEKASSLPLQGKEAWKKPHGGSASHRSGCGQPWEKPLLGRNWRKGCEMNHTTRASATRAYLMTTLWGLRARRSTSSMDIWSILL